MRISGRIRKIVIKVRGLQNVKSVSDGVRRRTNACHFNERTSFAASHRSGPCSSATRDGEVRRLPLREDAFAERRGHPSPPVSLLHDRPTSAPVAEGAISQVRGSFREQCGKSIRRRLGWLYVLIFANITTLRCYDADVWARWCRRTSWRRTRCALPLLERRQVCKDSSSRPSAPWLPWCWPLQSPEEESLRFSTVPRFIPALSSFSLLTVRFLSLVPVHFKIRCNNIVRIMFRDVNIAFRIVNRSSVLCRQSIASLFNRLKEKFK